MLMTPKKKAFEIIVGKGKMLFFGFRFEQTDRQTGRMTTVKQYTPNLSI